LFFLPILIFILIIYFGLLAFLFLFLQIGVFAFEQIGIPPGIMFFLLFLTLIGSGINIPVKRYTTDITMTEKIVWYFGRSYRIPRAFNRNTAVIAVNIGGAVIPTLLSLFLLIRWPHLLLANVIAVVFVSILVHRMARPIRGIGIATPALLPPVLAALTALVLQVFFGPHTAPIIAYVSGTLGTLIGADLLNIRKISLLGAPVASIGGAGTFDGIFLTGLIAVILTSL